MAISGKLLADFTSFYDAVQRAEVQLKGFTEGSENVERALTRMTDSLSGTRIVQQATLATEAVERIGGASKLTEAEQRKVNRVVSEALEKYQALGQEAPAAMVALEQATRQAEQPTAALSTAVGLLAAQLVQKASSAVIGFGKDALMTSARVESLAGVARFMGSQVGLTATEVDALATSLQRQGITTGQSYDAIVQMVRGNISLARATELATVAQGLARATGENSSATLGKLIQGIQTLGSEQLKGAGIILNFDQEYRKFIGTSGRAVSSLSVQEKQLIITAAVMREGEKIAGVYGVTNEFVGGKIQSMTRHQEEASKAIGDVFKPALVVAVDALTGLLKIVKEAPALFGAMGLGVVGLATAFTVMKGAAALGLISTTALTTGLGLLWPAVAVGATAFIAWNLGKWIGEVTKLTDAVEWLTGRLMGLTTAEINAGREARQYAESTAGKTAALKAQAAALERLKTKQEEATAAALKVAQADAAAGEAAKAAAEHSKKYAAAIAEINFSGQGWRKTLATINTETQAAVTRYLEAGVSQSALATAYGLTALQVRAVAQALTEHLAVQKETTLMWKEFKESARKELEAFTAIVAKEMAAQRDLVAGAQQQLLALMSASAQVRRTAALGGASSMNAQIETLQTAHQANLARIEAAGRLASSQGGAAWTENAKGLIAEAEQAHLAAQNNIQIASDDAGAAALGALQATTDGAEVTAGAVQQVAREFSGLQQTAEDVMSRINQLMADADRNLQRGGVAATMGFFQRQQATVLAQSQLPGGQLTGFATGGPVTRDGPIYAHAGEYVLPKGAPGGGGGVTVAITVNGSVLSDPHQIAAVVGDAFMARMRSLGMRLPSGA